MIRIAILALASILVLLILLAAVAPSHTSTLLQISPPEWVDKWANPALSVLEVIVVLVGVIYAGSQLRVMRATYQSSIQAERQKRALDLVSRFNDSHMLEVTERARGELKRGNVGDIAIWAYINFLEEMASSVLLGLADESICSGILRLVVLDVCETFKPYLELEKNKNAYKSLKHLCDRWRTVAVG